MRGEMGSGEDEGSESGEGRRVERMVIEVGGEVGEWGRGGEG